MAINNPWLNPLQRSFQDIKSKLIESMKLKLPEVTDYSEGNIFIILISLFAAMAEVLHYYIDNMARETFFVTARKYSSLIKHAKLVDYHIKCANPASVDILLYLNTGDVVPIDIHISPGTTFTSQGGINYQITKPYIWYAGTHAISVSATQIEYLYDISFGTVETSDDIVVTLGDLGTGNFYSEGTMVLEVNDSGVPQIWQLVETFAFSNPTSTHYKVELDSEQNPVIIFGNGLMGKKPSIGSVLTGSFGITKGEAGNTTSSTLVSVPTTIASQTSNIVCVNRNSASGGSNYEDFNMLKEHVPLSIKTLDVAITPEDFASITKMMPGVDKAYVDYECGKVIDMYITPDGGGIASQALIDQVRLGLLAKKVLGTAINVYPAKETLIYLTATVTGKPSFKSQDIQKQVVEAMMSNYDYNNSDIAKPVRVSEVYALLKKLSMVDYLTIENLYLKPSAIAYSDAVELYFDLTIATIQSNITYLLRFNESQSKFDILNLSGTLTGVSLPYNGVDTTWQNITLNGNDWNIRIQPSDGGNYLNGNIWRLSLLKNNVDQVSPEQAIPLFKSSAQCNLTIIEKV